jgi:flagellar hook protein FlgE
MLSSLYAGISGLLANSDALNVVGNNIANVNTMGFKSSTASFEDVLYQKIGGGTGTSQVGSGTALAAVQTDFSEGSLETTDSPTDLAIGGQGFFIVSNTIQAGGDQYYTRAGNFSLNDAGYLVDSNGDYVQGKQINQQTGTPAGVDVAINIPQTPSQPKATDTVDMVTNLQSDAAFVDGGITYGGANPNIATFSPSSGQYPWQGTYDVAIAARNAATITGTGSSAATIPAAGGMGSIIINGTSINLSTVNGMVSAAGPPAVVGLVNTINAQSAVTKVVASDTGGALTLTSTVNGNDIVLNQSGLAAGASLGWSSADVASTALYGSTMTVTPETPLPDGTTINPVAANVSSQQTTYTNWQGLGFDITTTASGYTTTPGAETVTMKGFVSSNADITPTITPSTTSNYSSSVTVYDSLGQSHVLTVYFSKVYAGTNATGNQTSTWQWNAVTNGNEMEWPPGTTPQTYDLVGTGYLTFNNNGALTSGGEPPPLTLNFAGAAQGQTVSLVMDSKSGEGSTTQYPTSSTTTYSSQDGYAPGVLQSISVGTDGTISGTYNNGQIVKLYQITLANFNNPQGLEKDGDNLYSETIASGNAYTNAPGQGGTGTVTADSLEESNVDLATQFVDMIVAQRGYEANSKVITTTDQVLQDLMDMVRS